LQEGDIVLLKDNQAARNTWPMAVVTSAIYSQDGKVRTVSLRTSAQSTSKFFTRPVTEVVLLSLSTDLKFVLHCSNMDCGVINTKRGVFFPLGIVLVRVNRTSSGQVWHCRLNQEVSLLVKAHGEDRSSCNCPLLCLDFSLARTACK